MFTEERQIHIQEIINEEKRVFVNDLSRRFNTSAVTIRRDLKLLEEQGTIKRVHGGAISKQSLFSGLALSQKEKIKTREKERIAKYAVGLVNPGDVIIIDSGSTTLQFARQLKNHSGITVITNALNVASELSKSNIKIILTGGEMNSDSLTLLGPLADQSLKNVTADKLFQGIDGVDYKVGLTTPNIMEAMTSRMMMNISGENILLADSSKFGRRSLGVVNKLDTLDKIITDDGLDKKEIKKLEELKIEVIVV